MDRDRTEICNIISEMLDNPDKHGIYPTSIAYEKLEGYVEAERVKAIGWMYAAVCIDLDKTGVIDGDLRGKNVPDILDRAKEDLAK